MRFYTVYIVGTPNDNMIKEKEEIQTLLSDILDANYDMIPGKDREDLRKLLDEEMKKRLTETTDYQLVNVMFTDCDLPHMKSSIKKSFFIGIKMNNDHLLLFAQYRQLTSLQEIAAWTVSRRLKTSQNLERLEKEENIPKALSSEIRKFFWTKEDTNDKMETFKISLRVKCRVSDEDEDDIDSLVTDF